MGAIHGKGRFQCSGCHQGFSWRLDLAAHLQQCKAALDRCILLNSAVYKICMKAVDCWNILFQQSSSLWGNEYYQYYFNCHWRIPGANSDYFSRKTKDQYSEYYLLETCFLCGHQLSGIHSEEASFVKGLQKLYHSKRPLVEVSFYFLLLSVSLDQMKWEEDKNSNVMSYQVVTVDVSTPNFA